MSLAPGISPMVTNRKSANGASPSTNNNNNNTPEETLLEFARRKDNKKCFDCNKMGTQYVNMTIGTFICFECSGLLREFSYRVKGNKKKSLLFYKSNFFFFFFK